MFESILMIGTVGAWLLLALDDSKISKFLMTFLCFTFLCITFFK